MLAHYNMVLYAWTGCDITSVVYPRGKDINSE